MSDDLPDPDILPMVSPIPDLLPAQSRPGIHIAPPAATSHTDDNLPSIIDYETVYHSLDHARYLKRTARYWYRDPTWPMILDHLKFALYRLRSIDKKTYCDQQMIEEIEHFFGSAGIKI